MLTLKIVTLNCWGIAWPYSTPDRVRRISAIAEKLAADDYDIVALQEIWSEEDYEYIRKHVINVLPHAFYFHSGFIGSGVCILSKAEIVDTLMFRYSLNGYAHHIHRGDWFGGKVVGLAHVLYRGLHIYVYTTHVHAEYDRANDLYLPHRLVQAFELSQFVKASSRGADMTVVLGDLNLEPEDLGYKLILANAHLLDSWTERQSSGQPADSDPVGSTCDAPVNSYTTKDAAAKAPQGKRIDYILYNSRHAVNVATKECYTTFGQVPGQGFSYSDHQGLFARFEVEPDGEARLHKNFHREQPLQLRPFLTEAVSVLGQALGRITYDRKFVLGALFIFAGIFIYTIDLELSYPSFAKFVVGSRFVLTLVIGYVVWNGLVMMRMEQKALLAAKEGMTVLIRRCEGITRDPSPDSGDGST